MEVILKEDVPNLGFRDELVKVRNGYGLNYLIPKGYAIIANDANRKMHTETVKQRAFKDAKVKTQAETAAETFKGITLKIKMKVGEGKKLFGSVTVGHIADALKLQGHEIDKKRLSLDGPSIKKTGAYTATATLHREVKAKINFEVIEE